MTQAILGRGHRARPNARGSNRGGNRSQKPFPLMSRPMPPPFGMRRPMPPPGPHPENRFGGMEPPFFPPGCNRGFPPRGGHGVRGRGMRPPFGHGLPPRGRGGLLPPPPMNGPPAMFRPGPPRMMGPPGMMMRGRGGPYFRGGRGGPLRGGRFNKIVRGKSKKGIASPNGEMNKPWVTEAMKNEILKKHKLHQKAKKTGVKEDWDIFREHRNKVTTMLREVKIEYIGKHPDEDVDKILAEAANSVSVNEESLSPKIQEPMEEGGGAPENLDKSADETPTPDPEVQNKPLMTEQ